MENIEFSPPHRLTRLGYVWLSQTLITTLSIEGLLHMTDRQTDTNQAGLGLVAPDFINNFVD